jgi:hypothetical protein
MIKYGNGSIYWGGKLNQIKAEEIYPSYESTVEILAELDIPEDFKSASNSIRFGHRKTENNDIFFVANRTNDLQKTSCTFRATGIPELWLGTTGETRKIVNYTVENGLTTIQLEFFPYESFFVTFSGNNRKPASNKRDTDFPVFTEIKTLEGAWNVEFDQKYGGPENIRFDELQDWVTHEMRGIKYYSGIATYYKTFNIDKLTGNLYYIDLGIIKDIARVKLNGKEMGVIWCAPWRIDISGGLKEGSNILEIQVANRWINRLLGDQQAPDAGVRKVKFENGLLGGLEFTTGRYTFTTKQAITSSGITEPLSSGLLGPVRIMKADYLKTR